MAKKQIHTVPENDLHTMADMGGKKVQDSFVNEVPDAVASLSDLATVATSTTGTQKLRSAYDELTMNPKNY